MIFGRLSLDFIGFARIRLDLTEFARIGLDLVGLAWLWLVSVRVCVFHGIWQFVIWFWLELIEFGWAWLNLVRFGRLLLRHFLAEVVEESFIALCDAGFADLSGEAGLLVLKSLKTDFITGG